MELQTAAYLVPVDCRRTMPVSIAISFSPTKFTAKDIEVVVFVFPNIATSCRIS